MCLPYIHRFPKISRDPRPRFGDSEGSQVVSPRGSHIPKDPLGIPKKKEPILNVVHSLEREGGRKKKMWPPLWKLYILDFFFGISSLLKAFLSHSKLSRYMRSRAEPSGPIWRHPWPSSKISELPQQYIHWSSSEAQILFNKNPQQ
jgi:hypothetical protein